LNWFGISVITFGYIKITIKHNFLIDDQVIISAQLR
jgi:hypothetical protein